MFTKFATVMQNGSFNRPDYYKIEIQKSNIADSRHFENR